MKSTFTLVFVVSVFATVGCHTPYSEQLSEPTDDEGAMYEAHCDGNHASIGDCYREARKTCGGPITVVDKDGSERVVKSGHTLITKARRSLVYTCKV